VKLGVGYRKEGYRLNTQSISAPIFKGPRVVACLTVIWTASALSFDKALEQYKDKLLKSAEGISDALNRIESPD
jgi:IclR family mhp operon transcriptional activator